MRLTNGTGPPASNAVFTIPAEAGMGYPFDYTADLQAWARFGFLQLDDTGSAVFELNPVGTRGFLREGGGEALTDD